MLETVGEQQAIFKITGNPCSIILMLYKIIIDFVNFYIFFLIFRITNMQIKQGPVVGMILIVNIILNFFVI